jgi:hypothetical protein
MDLGIQPSLTRHGKIYLRSIQALKYLPKFKMSLRDKASGVVMRTDNVFRLFH